jgi:hypothetical protein
MSNVVSDCSISDRFGAHGAAAVALIADWNRQAARLSTDRLADASAA